MSNSSATLNNSVIQIASKTYAIQHWGEGYFAIADDGTVSCRPDGSKGIEISLTELAQKAAADGLQLPLLVRFPDILSDRVRRLCSAFDKVRRQYVYAGQYSVVYPIKVNQQRCVVEQIVQAEPGRVGLEAGSKPELMAVLAQTFGKSTVDDYETIICNGYKDREYIRLALIGSQLGKRIFIVIEQADELSMVLQQAEELNVSPRLGVRLRLSSIAKGKWQNSGGEKSKFGLSAPQLVEFLQQLKQKGKLDLLQLMHFHVGSQVAELEDLRVAVEEAARYYQELHAFGAGINVFDVGGGLGVDYQGSRSTEEFSINYNLTDYAATIVKVLKDCCDRMSLPQPEIITESGRALTAHHAVLISNVLAVEHSYARNQDIAVEHAVIDQARHLLQQAECSDEPEALLSILEQCDKNLLAGQRQYQEGGLNLTQRAALESDSQCCQRLILRRLHDLGSQHEKMSSLIERLADKYVCNFSLFQSAPDAWGIGQVFPVMPLQRLHEPTDHYAVIHDLTCDSDGQLTNYPLSSGLSTTLPVHAIKAGEQYLLGVFMLGAYQEILGDIHNLFGDTNSINVLLNRQGGYSLEGAEPGDRIDQLLEYVHYDTSRLLSQYKLKLERTRLSEVAKQEYYLELAAGLSGYTYLED